MTLGKLYQWHVSGRIKGKGRISLTAPPYTAGWLPAPGSGLWRPALHILWGSPARLPQAFSLLEPSTAITVTLCVPHTAQVPRMVSPEAPLKTQHLFPSLTDPGPHLKGHPSLKAMEHTTQRTNRPRAHRCGTLWHSPPRYSDSHQSTDG